tara:strand:- start:386 stop:601 length:216 start_codon:yes stop_codon:yes gene_type:complete
MYTIFDNFFAPQQILVVTEEALKRAQQEQRLKQMKALNNQINELTALRDKVSNEYRINRLDADGEEAHADA